MNVLKVSVDVIRLVPIHLEAISVLVILAIA